MLFYKFKDPYGDDVTINLSAIVSYRAFSGYTEVNFGNSTLSINCPTETLDNIFKDNIVKDLHLV